MNQIKKFGVAKESLFFLAVFFLISNAYSQKKSERINSTNFRQIDIQIGRGFIPFRFPEEVRRIEKSLNGAILFGKKEQANVGLFLDYQKRFGIFPFYRLSSGFLQEEFYRIEADYYSAGIKASLWLNRILEKSLRIKLPTYLEIYQSYFIGVNVTNVIVPDEIYQNGVILGFGTDQGVSDFPKFNEDISLIFGTNVGINFQVPKVPLLLYSEIGFGPLENVSLGVVIRIGYLQKSGLNP